MQKRAGCRLKRGAMIGNVETLPERRRAHSHRRANREIREVKPRMGKAFWLNGAAQESNLPSRGLHDLTGFEDETQWRGLIAAVQQLRIEAVAVRDGQCD